MFLALSKTIGAASSFLLLFIFIAILFGIPLLLIALRLAEKISDRQREAEWESRKQQELEEHSKDRSMDDANSTGRIISANDMKNA